MCVWTVFSGDVFIQEAGPFCCKVYIVRCNGFGPNSGVVVDQ